MNFPEDYLTVLKIARDQFKAKLGDREILIKSELAGDSVAPHQRKTGTPNQKQRQVLTNE